MISVILSGGSGSRLWPLSRALRPKQFLGLTSEQTLFQLTLARLSNLVKPLEPIVVAMAAQAEHWIVVKGTAKVTIGEEARLISENQSVYIVALEKFIFRRFSGLG